ncbi:MAG: hypothetical protein AAGA08_10435 [Pseudomonadota bacterium]
MNSPICVVILGAVTKVMGLNNTGFAAQASLQTHKHGGEFDD